MPDPTDPQRVKKKKKKKPSVTPSTPTSSVGSVSGALVLIATVLDESFDENRWAYLKPLASSGTHADDDVDHKEEEADKLTVMNRRLLGRTIASILGRRDVAEAFAIWRDSTKRAASVSVPADGLQDAHVETLPLDDQAEEAHLPDDLDDDDDDAEAHLPDEADLLPEEEDDEDRGRGEDPEEEEPGSSSRQQPEPEEPEEDDDDQEDDDRASTVASSSQGSHVDTLAFRLKLDDDDDDEEDEEGSGGREEEEEPEPPGDDEWPSEAEDDEEEQTVVETPAPKSKLASFVSSLEADDEVEEEEERPDSAPRSRLSDFVSNFDKSPSQTETRAMSKTETTPAPASASKLQTFVSSFQQQQKSTPEQRDEEEEGPPPPPPERTPSTGGSKLAAFVSSLDRPETKEETPTSQETKEPTTEGRRRSRVSDFVKVFDKKEPAPPPEEPEEEEEEEEEEETERRLFDEEAADAAETNTPGFAIRSADDGEKQLSGSAGRLAALVSAWATRREMLRRGFAVWRTVTSETNVVSASSSLDGEKALKAYPPASAADVVEDELAELSRSLILAFIVRRSESRAKLADERRGWRAWRSLNGGRWYDEDARKAHDALFRAHLIRDRQMRLRVIVATRAQSRRTAALARAWVRWCALRAAWAAEAFAERASSMGSSAGTLDRPTTPTALDDHSQTNYDQAPPKRRPQHRLARNRSNFGTLPSPQPHRPHRPRRQRRASASPSPESPGKLSAASFLSDGANNNRDLNLPVLHPQNGANQTAAFAFFARVVAKRRKAILSAAFHSFQSKLYYAQLMRERQRSASATARLEAAQFEAAELREVRAIAEEELATCSKKAADEVDRAWRQAKASDDGHAAQSAAFAALEARLEADRFGQDDQIKALERRYNGEIEKLKQREAELLQAARNHEDLEQMLIQAKMELAMLKSGMS